MPAYSAIPAVDEAVRRFIREEDAPASAPPILDGERLRASLVALDKDVKVVPVVMPDFELSRIVLAAKATKLVSGLLYAQLDIYIAAAAPLAHVVWESKRLASDRDATFSAKAPSLRAAELETGARRVLAAAGFTLVERDEADRVMRIEDDPF